ncbi:hypothetical protein EON65_38935 [archaeon]|nr:MAG: hypothetical protein EON65_38935 [archaeon]
MGGSSVVEVITGIVCPLLGMLISNGQWLAPLAVMQKARETHRLDNINPYPFPMIVMNATGWVIYSCYTKDHFLFWAVLPGVLLGLYYTIIVLTILTKSSAAEQHSPTYLAVERLLLFSFFFWSLLAIISTTAFPTDKESQFFIGIGTVIITILYYSAPLSSVLIVIRNKDSATMYLPLILVNMTNATLWTTYGLFATQDIMLWLPNGLGILLALLQLTLKFLYRLPTPPSSPPSSSSKLLVEEDGQDKKTMADNEGGRNRTRKRSVSVGNLGEMGGTSAKSAKKYSGLTQRKQVFPHDPI